LLLDLLGRGRFAQAQEFVKVFSLELGIGREMRVPIMAIVIVCLTTAVIVVVVGPETSSRKGTETGVFERG
jgi:hypothetical protein